MNLKTALSQKLYPQRCSATPLSLISAGGSGFNVPQPKGLQYSAFLFLCKKEDGVMTYMWDDLVALEKIIQSKFRKDRNFFKKLKVRYEKEWKKTEVTFKKINQTNFSALSLDSVCSIARDASHAIALSVGVGHMIEPYAIAGDQRIRKEVFDAISDPKLANHVFLTYTTPRAKSFASVASDYIRDLSRKDIVSEGEIKDFISKFFWIQNTYSGRRPLTDARVREMVSEYKEQSKNLSEKNVQSPGILKKPRELSSFLISELRALSFVAVWQDERKKNILIAIDYFERVLEAIADKTGIPLMLLRYLEPSELNPACADMASVLEERRRGVVFLQSDAGIEEGSRELYEKFNKILNADSNAHDTELRGTSASVGKAIGRVRVCLSHDSIKEVKEGEILVASMTRPEYLPAMRRAAAFVTDEGGITCHAAIVAREMGKPCVIGTRLATRFLKDGDMVEVKGNHGVVVVLERAV